MSDDDTRSRAIMAAAKAVIAETRRITLTFAELEDQISRRKNAVRELAALTDVTADLQPASMSIVPLEDVVLLEIYKAGSSGAIRKDLKRAWINKIGREGASANLDAVLASLAEQGRIVEQGGAWTVLGTSDFDIPAGVPRSMRERIIHILKDQAGGIKAQQISDELSRLQGTEVSVTAVSPVMTQLKRAGKVIHEGVYWRLAADF